MWGMNLKTGKRFMVTGLSIDLYLKSGTSYGLPHMPLYAGETVSKVKAAVLPGA